MANDTDLWTGASRCWWSLLWGFSFALNQRLQRRFHWNCMHTDTQTNTRTLQDCSTGVQVSSRSHPTASACQLVTDLGRRHLRSVDVNTCAVPCTWLGDRSFAVAGPRLWNNLPVELRQRDICLSKFRRLLKTFLFC